MCMKPKIEAIKLVRDGGVTRVARTVKNFFFLIKRVLVAQLGL